MNKKAQSGFVGEILLFMTAVIIEVVVTIVLQGINVSGSYSDLINLLYHYVIPIIFVLGDIIAFYGIVK